MIVSEDKRWLAIMDAMCAASKFVPDEPDLITAAVQELANLIVATRPILGDRQAATLVAFGGLMWREALKEQSAKLQALMALGVVKSVDKMDGGARD